MGEAGEEEKWCLCFASASQLLPEKKDKGRRNTSINVSSVTALKMESYFLLRTIWDFFFSSSLEMMSDLRLPEQIWRYGKV